MVFSSQTFLFFFLPLAGLCVFVRSKPLQNTLLLMASLLFYAWGEPKMVVLMALVTLVAYLSGFAMVHFEGRPGAKKAVLVATIVYAGDPKYYGSLMYWLAAIAYTLQIYFDFSGYSDMAIGLGRMFGFHFLENFNYPYISLSVTEFWRRWHISLSTWFRDYVYIPLVRSLAADVSIVPPLLWMIPGLIFSAPIHQRVHLGDSWGAEVVRNTACLALLAICILFSVSATFNPFIYFRF